MDRDPVLQSNHAKVTALQFGHFHPEPHAILFLRLHSKRLLDRANAPRFPKIRPLLQNLVFKVLGEPVLVHDPEDSPICRVLASG